MHSIWKNLKYVMVLSALIMATSLSAQDNKNEYIKVFNSSQDFETTVQTIKDNANTSGWVVLDTKLMHKNLKNAGYDILPVAIIELCNPQFAGALLSQSETRMFSAMMPCRVSVYELEGGKVQIAMLNSHLAGDMYDGFDLKALLKATLEMEQMIKPVK